MIQLNEQQKVAVNYNGNVVVTACPGSGKTRVLTCRVIRGLEELASSKHRVIAMTYTNRATNEINSRLDQLSISHDQLWAGTIHSFALEWILRPYASYIPILRKGFSIADEFLTDSLLKQLIEKYGYSNLNINDINTKHDRNGNVANNEQESKVYKAYQKYLKDKKLIDYDDVLYYAYELLIKVQEIPQTLAKIIRLICVDEIQDTQDLQYGILSTIYKASTDPPTLFFVGDSDQCIYESLGAVSKSADQIASEFGLKSIKHFILTGNYRSTQRIIKFYQLFRPNNPIIKSLISYATDHGSVKLYNQTISKDNLPGLIAPLIEAYIRFGIPQSEICVLAPHWWHIRGLSRSLVKLLPDVDFDAPGLSPFHCQRDNFWFKVARLFLTTPSPNLYRTRFRWASEIIRDLEVSYNTNLHEDFKQPRQLLRLINSIISSSEDGLKYLDEVFSILMRTLEIDINSNNVLVESRKQFFEKANARINEIGSESLTDIRSFKKMFRHPSGVVISTCHGVKGEEYEVIIAFGLLKGYIPNWETIIHNPTVADDQASKLLYVICSRAKRFLHLIAESGRITRNGNPYETTKLLRTVTFDYDN
jgi:superfamily I DNA/RNA helicase